MNSIVEVSNLHFKYPTRDKATLQIPHFQIQKGEKVFLFGPSGKGKTTFLEVLSGILIPTGGRVQVLGQNLAELSASGRDHFRGLHLGYIFQSFNLIPYLTVRENIELPIRLLKHNEKVVANLSSNIKDFSERLGIAEI
ncbi:MAG: ATP-binding cassette domain-containing protein, partial [Pseudobdellovibrionaceae bacterium]